MAPSNVYERAYAIVPMIGKGTADDPRRPQFGPRDQDKTLPEDQRILAVYVIPSDDGRFALVEFVAKDRGAFRRLNGSTRSTDVKLFVKGRDDKDTIEKEFRKYKHDFTIDTFGTRGFVRKGGAR